MIWKPKEKELTPEEAIAIAKKELSPLWFGSSPLLAGIRQDENFLVVPLSKEFNNKPWMIFLIDPTDFEGENAMLYAKEWHRRYHPNGLGFIMIFVPSYDYLRNPDSIRKLGEKHQISFPFTLDSQGLLAYALNASKLPKVILLSKGNIINSHDGRESFDEIESGIQKFLRSTDPGLPLLPLFFSKISGVKNVGRYEFGYKLKIGSAVMGFPDPGFVAGEDNIRRAKFIRTEDNKESNNFFISGMWQQYPEGIATADQTAYIEFESPAERVSLIAAPAGKPGLDLPKISIEVGGLPVYDAISGEDVKMEESGDTQIKIIKPLLYNILVGLTEGSRRVGLRFPNAKRAPVILYGFRFGE